MKKAFIYLLSLTVLLCLYSCAGAVPVESCISEVRYGFFSGLIHGFITPISFIFSLFDEETVIYAINNTGGWYDFGFLLGSGGWGFLAGKGSKRNK